ncbi:galactosylceramidase [Solihabitans fulvus]|uniref:galactosylceramidase n=1 Tax=Solihabitans fulvus TaxID=1892852 RepID=A0A5B2XMP2_9PSEU|nr:ricin-type beta-trefoil lectin domain protein [Solihabitans fulvus]KAA2264220.1 galactosylceramidase [Solihabitans fulvus]
MTSVAQRRFPVLAALAVLLGALFVLGVPAHAATSTSITVDGGGSGRVFDGIGAISGGGGNSRLLVDYPEPQRGQLLDYLFKPGYGASLQILKVEIGGDTNSTDGAEASHEHARGAIDCDQGYEWWLAEQAKSRNPAIKLSGLSWGAPGWVNPTANSFYTANSITYLLDWLGCAKQHNLSIDYLGGWNERYNGGDTTAKTWYENLRAALNRNGYGSTKVVAGDNGWAAADDMGADPAFRAAVDIVGVHYPCGYNSGFTSCGSIGSAQALGNPLWASENGSEDSNTGAPSVARALNRDYIDARMTSYLNWPIIAALYPNLYYATDGMSVANQPWSGHYDIGKTTWVTAQTTQFTRPGWHYLDSASGYLAGSGSYVSLKSTNNSDYSTVAETMDATAAQTAQFTVAGGLSTGVAHVWATNVRSDNPADWFVRQPDITPSGGHYTATLQPGYVYTFSTTTPAGPKGAATAPPAGSLALPYSDSLDTPAATTSPRYFADMNGAFARTGCAAGRSGSCVQQMAPATPVRWTDEPHNAPYTIMGDASWANYTVSTDALLRQAGTVEVLGRVMQQGQNNNGLDAYHLRVTDTGAWSIVRTDQKWTTTTLRSGAVNALGLNTWHTIALGMQGSTLTASVDGKVVGSATDATFTNGQAGFGVGGYQTDQFDNFAVAPGENAVAPSGAIASGLSGKCVNVGQTRLVNAADEGGPAQLYDCDGRAAQGWIWAGGTLTHNGMCLDVAGAGTANGTSVEVWECNGGANQQWQPQSDGTLRSVQSGRCLDDPNWSTTNGTQLTIYDCNGGANQKWNLPG